MGAVLTAALLAPAKAHASSGEISQALASADWTRGSIAGSVTSSGCTDAPPAASCTWIPYATLGPGTAESECASPDRDWPDLGEGVSLAWWMGEAAGVGVGRFDHAIQALEGSPDQLLCLFVIERVHAGGAVAASRSVALDAALLEASPQVPQAEEPDPDPTGEPSDAPVEAEPPSAPAEPAEPPAEGEPPAETEPPREEPPLETEPPVEAQPQPAAEEPPALPVGEITRATATADGTWGDIAGSATWDGCAGLVAPPSSFIAPEEATPPFRCARIPYATLGPGSSESECASPDRDWPGLGEGVSLAYWGGQLGDPGVARFDFPGVWLDGEPGQLLCLFAIEIAPTGERSYELDAALLHDLAAEK